MNTYIDPTALLFALRARYQPRPNRRKARPVAVPVAGAGAQVDNNAVRMAIIAAVMERVRADEL